MNKNLTATILLVLAVALYFTVTEKVLDGAKEVKAVNDKYASAIQNAKNLIKIRDQVTNDYNHLSEENRDRLAKMVPGTVDNIRLIIDLESIALDHGLVLKNVTAVTSNDKKAPEGEAHMAAAAAAKADEEDSIATPELDTVTVSFDVTAPFLTFSQFMQSLESNLRIMDVSHLGLTASDNGVYEYEVQLKTYWLRQQ